MRRTSTDLSSPVRITSLHCHNGLVIVHVRSPDYSNHVSFHLNTPKKRQHNIESNFKKSEKFSHSSLDPSNINVHITQQEKHLQWYIPVEMKFPKAHPRISHHATLYWQKYPNLTPQSNLAFIGIQLVGIASARNSIAALYRWHAHYAR